MYKNINDSQEEAVVVEEATELPAEVVAEVAEEAPVEEFAVVEPIKEDKPKADKKAKASANAETVALFAKNNVSWSEIGFLSAGYNIVSKEDSEKWLTVKNVRLASPEEIAAKAAN